jgi:hypothetical protein
VFKHYALLSTAVLLAVFGLASCAAIMSSSHQKITFNTAPAGATVEVSDAMGMPAGSCETPCSLDLKRKREYKVVISKTGYAPVEMALDRSSNGWIWGNLLLGGVIGLVIDFTSGSAYKLSPKDLNVTLSPTTTGNLGYMSLGESLVIIDYDKLSDQEKQAVSKLKPEPIPSR